MEEKRCILVDVKLFVDDCTRSPEFTEEIRACIFCCEIVSGGELCISMTFR
jgi:hypothetical protein